MCTLGQLYKTKNEQNKIKEIKQKKVGKMHYFKHPVLIAKCVLIINFVLF